MYKLSFLACAAASILSAFAPPAFAGRQLSVEELKALLTGKTISVFNEKQGKLYKIFFAQDGTSHFQGKSYTGKWWINDSAQHCNESRHFSGCYPIFDNGGVFQKMDGDVVMHTIQEVQDGDQR